jgi:hypothetical protein
MGAVLIGPTTKTTTTTTLCGCRKDIREEKVVILVTVGTKNAGKWTGLENPRRGTRGNIGGRDVQKKYR